MFLIFCGLDEFEELSEPEELWTVRCIVGETLMEI